jgi:glycosyltransferase involved in cell wall biosynthesis
VLTSNSSSLPEVAGDAALLVDPHDTRAIAAGMVRLARDEVLRQELRQRGYRRAAQFTWDRCAEETLRVLYG